MPYGITQVNPPRIQRRLNRAAHLHEIAAHLLSDPSQYDRGRRAAYIAILLSFPHLSDHAIRQVDLTLRHRAGR